VIHRAETFPATGAVPFTQWFPSEQLPKRLRVCRWEQGAVSHHAYSYRAMQLA